MLKLAFCLLLSSVKGFALTGVRSTKPVLPQITMAYKPVDMIRQLGKGPFGPEWTYNDFIENLNKHKIDAATIADNDKIIIIDNNYADIPTQYNVHALNSLPELTNDIVKRLIEQHINFDVFKIADAPHLPDIPIFVQLIFFYILGNTILSFFLRRNGNAGMMGMNPFEKMKQEVQYVKPEDIDVKFDDVAGCDETKYELMEVVDFLKNPDKFKRSGAKIPTGILLEGSPGTGKTLLARAVAGEAGVSFIQASGSQFIEMFVGVGAARVRSLFEAATKANPCVIFIDEIDAVGRQRGAGFNSGNDEREQTLNQLLTNMDGFDKTSGIIVLAATNRADILDSALTRPGRFDRKISVPLPDVNGRKKILEVHMKNKFISPDVDIREFASLTSGFSGADLANMVNEAAILSVRYNNTEIDRQSFIDAFEKVTIGLPKLSKESNKDVNRLVAYHEAGHTVMACLFNDFFTVRKVTINANTNGAGGYTLFTSNERYMSYPTKKYLLAKIMVALGGRAAEVILYNQIDKKDKDTYINYKDSSVFKDIKNLDITTGASSDLNQATQIARTYVNLFGINDEYSLFDSNNPAQPFVGREMGLNNNKISELSKAKVDKEIEKIINFAYKQTLNIIEQNVHPLTVIANKLTLQNSVNKTTLDNLDIYYV